MAGRYIVSLSELHHISASYPKSYTHMLRTERGGVIPTRAAPFPSL